MVGRWRDTAPGERARHDPVASQTWPLEVVRQLCSLGRFSRGDGWAGLGAALLPSLRFRASAVRDACCFLFIWSRHPTFLGESTTTSECTRVKPTLRSCPSPLGEVM